MLATNCRPAAELHMDTWTHGQTQTEKKKQKKMEAALQRDTIFHSDLSCLSVEMVYHGKLQSDQF